jgi:hypothetical protein
MAFVAGGNFSQRLEKSRGREPFRYFWVSVLNSCLRSTKERSW